MALVMFRCFECDFISSSMQEVRIHIQLEHAGGVEYSERSPGLNLVEISSSSQGQDSPCIVPQETFHGSMKWTHDMVLFLIDLFKKHEDKFHKIGCTSKQVWNHIARDFAQKYYAISGESCNEKWRNLKRTYRNVKNNLQRAGSGRMKFLYFEEMDDIFAKRPEIIRPITFTTRESEPLRKDIDECFPSTKDEESSNTSTSVSLSKNRKRHALQHCCTHFLTEMKKLEEAKEASEQRRHEEKMALLRELIDIKKQKLYMLKKTN